MDLMIELAKAFAVELGTYAVEGAGMELGKQALRRALKKCKIAISELSWYLARDAVFDAHDICDIADQETLVLKVYDISRHLAAKNSLLSHVPPSVAGEVSQFGKWHDTVAR